MNRTSVIFAVAGSLALTALVLWFSPLQHRVTADPGSSDVPGSGTLRMSAALSDPLVVAGGEREVFLKVDLQAVDIGRRERAGVNLALVLDRSGSMAGQKMESARKAARQLLSQLDDRDRFALITFGSDV